MFALGTNYTKSSRREWDTGGSFQNLNQWKRDKQKGNKQEIKLG